MKKFITTGYEILTKKIKDSRGVRFVMLTDLHGLSFGEENRLLLEEIDRLKPDAVLITGDMIVRSEHSSLKPVETLIKHIVNKCKVYYSLGNHEFKPYSGGCYQEEYLEYEANLSASGVCFLHNEKTEFTIRGNRFTIFGLELPIIYYHKPNSPKLTLEKMEELIGKPAPQSINILLAHNPKYGRTYLEWGGDLILSGHYHGGIVRFGKHIGLTCPQFLLFPPFCCGDFHRGESHMLVSAGLGEHTIPVRIHNPRELLVIDMKPLEKHGGYV